MQNSLEESLISKKELLETYKISYGALYRWKRKGLIPEDWFIKRATVTGQETFFPASLICERIELIMDLKDDAQLDEIAQKIGNNEKNKVTLVLDTVFGEKSLVISDIKGIYLEKGDEKTDITMLITSRMNQTKED